MATLYHVGTGAWDSATWSTTSGGAATNTPTAADNCIFDANSGNCTIGTGSVCRSWTVNGYTGTITHSSGITFDIGDATAGTSNYAINFVTSGWTYILGNATTSATRYVSTSATQQTIHTNGKTFGNLTFQGTGSSWILGSALNAPAATLLVTQCAWATNNFNVAVGTFNSSSASTRTVDFGTSTVTLKDATGTSFTMNTATNLTFSGANSTIIIGAASNTDRTFAGGGQTFGTLTYTVANSGGRLIIAGNNTFNTLNIPPARALRLTAGSTQTVTNFTPLGADYTANNGYIYMPGDTYGASLPDSAAVSITDDFDIRIRFAADNWSLSGAQRIAAKYGASGQRSWRLYSTAGALTFDMSTNGTNSSVANASVNISTAGVVDGSPIWLRVTREKATGAVKFYTAPDSASMPSSWTQLGTTITSTTSSLFDSTTILTIGGERTGTNSNPGKYYWFQMRNNILDNGTGIQVNAQSKDKVFNADSWTETSSNAATVTLNSGAVWGDGRLVIDTTSAGSAATINKVGMNIAGDFLSLKDSTVSGVTPGYAGYHSILVSNTTNWILFDAPNRYGFVNFQSPGVL